MFDSMSSLAADVKHRSTLHNIHIAAKCMTCVSNEVHYSYRAIRAYQALAF